MDSNDSKYDLQFLKRAEFWLLVIIFFGFLFRWIGLDYRAVHHDESLHGSYAKYMYLAPRFRFYKYDPLLHGPLIYHLISWFYSILGVSIEAMRSVSALFGSVFLFVPMLLVNNLSRYAIMALTALLAFSPSIVYWSRFSRNEPILLLLLLLGFALFQQKNKKIGFLALPILFSLHWTSKESIYVHALIVGCFFIWKKILQQFDKNIKSYAEDIKALFFNKQFLKYFAISLIVSVFIYCYFYSAGFKYPEGILDGLYRKSLTYWWNQHKINRIPGPFLYQSIVIFLYEPVLVFLFFTTIGHWLFNASKSYRIPLAVGLLLSVILHVSQRGVYPILGSSWMQTILPFDYYFFFSYLILGISVPTYYIFRNKITLAFLGYMLFSFLFTYSYLGEKVPWLSSYAVVTGFLFCIFYLYENPSIAKGKVFRLGLGIVALFQLTLSFKTNFSRAGSKNELISQVHTTKEADILFNDLAKKLDQPLHDKRYRVLNASSHQWPITWYLYLKPGYTYVKLKPSNFTDYDYIITDEFNPDAELWLEGEFVSRKFDMRAFWLPTYANLTIPKLLKTTITRDPFNTTDSVSLRIWRKAPIPQ